jgi:hypothetical protein
MGPTCYNSLFELWKEVQTKDLAWFQTNAPNATEITLSLLRRMRDVDNDQHHEGFLSTKIACAYQRLIPLLDAGVIEPFDLTHQVYIPNKSSVHVDVHKLIVVMIH